MIKPLRIDVPVYDQINAIHSEELVLYRVYMKPIVSLQNMFIGKQIISDKLLLERILTADKSLVH